MSSHTVVCKTLELPPNFYRFPRRQSFVIFFKVVLTSSSPEFMGFVGCISVSGVRDLFKIDLIINAKTMVMASFFSLKMIPNTLPEQ